ncbi:guanitoxin biosynthesis L-enduracididine beta-hydroxylase GntD [Nonomuraea sp. NPDC050643]|uniref:guanitoxin biosynthesis L-enduracididine beta-hydroxylase GntD n=1 Tax=Nonomuraea sp. NPDC050643 TaxID=3155660 RepID=UPI0033DE96DF
MTTTQTRHFVHHHALSVDEAADAIALAHACRRRYESPGDPSFLADAGYIAQDLPDGVRRLANTARLDDRKHAVLFSGGLVNDEAIEPTPWHWRDADTPGSRVYGFLLVLYGALFGDMIGWATQQDGRVVTDVVPTPGQEDGLVSSCSKRELSWHTEDAFSPYRADYVGLYCLRSPTSTATTVSYVDMSEVPDDIAELLADDRFTLLPDLSHDPDNNSDKQHYASAEAFDRLEGLRVDPPRVPILSGNLDAPVLRIDRDFVLPAADDADSARALAWITRHLDGNLYEIPLSPGDACLIDNNNSVHGRRPFQPRYDGKDRWLKRVNVVTDLRRTRPGRATAHDRVIG